MNVLKYLSILMLGVLFLSACSALQGSPVPPTPSPEEPVSTNTPTTEPEGEEPPGGEMIVGENAIVEELRLLIMESFPVQVDAVISGFFRDGCTTIYKIASQREGESFTITILTQRPSELACTEALVPYEETISLEVAGLPAGTYTVQAYDQTANFTLEVDNVIQEPTSCREPDADQQLFSRTIAETGAAFCFLFPQDFNILGSGAPDFFQLIGPQYGEGPEPVSASLTIATLDPEGKSLDQYVQEKLDDYPDFTFSPQEITLSGETAIVVDEYPGRLFHRMVYTEHEGLLYEFAFGPVEESFPEATADMERLYELVLSSWRFLE